MSTQAKAGTPLDLSFGLRNAAKKYLTAENFGHRIESSSNTMKKKQIFFLEQKPGEETVYIRTHLNRYLYVNGDGTLKADAEETNKECRFLIVAQANGSWALQSEEYGWWVGTNPEVERSCFSQDYDSSSHDWTVHLAMHPQICLKNVKRHTFMHLNDDKNAITTDEVIPWGDDATITLSFNDEDGTYSLSAANGQYLSSSGALNDNITDGEKFIIVFHGGSVSFKSYANGKFVTSLGASGVTKACKSGITQDEQYIMEDSYPQLKFTSVNGKKISIKQGIELSASQTETTDLEIFQIEPVGNNKWTIKSCKNKYWRVSDGAVLADVAVEEGDAPQVIPDEAKFEIEWLGPKIAIKASNGSYCNQKKNGYIHTQGKSSDEEGCSFVYEIVNRPKLVLRGQYGFVGTLPSGLLECNKSTPEVFTMHVSKGFCQISHANGKYWKVGENGVSCTGDSPEQYTMSLHEDSMMCLMKDGKYFETHQNGALTLTGSKPEKNTFFEY